MGEKNCDRIEVTKQAGNKVFSRIIHNPSEDDKEQTLERLTKSEILEIREDQHHEPVYEGPENVVDYVPTRHWVISFLIAENI